MGEEAAGAVALCERAAVFCRHPDTECVLLPCADCHEAAIGCTELGREAIVYVELLVHELLLPVLIIAAMPCRVKKRAACDAREKYPCHDGLKQGALYVSISPMQTANTKEELRAMLAPQRGKRIVFVPTMGALHEGHATLLRQARELAGADGCVVASVFLNPVQFDNAGDLATYPKTPAQDLETCDKCGVDVVFMPSPDTMYCGDRSIVLEENHLSTVLCGASRPGHFAGVCLVVCKLFNLVQPTDAIFGKKDYQQLAILRRMVRDLDIPITIHGAEIVRGDDGLALSSRNVRLTPEHRTAAPAIRRNLLSARDAYASGENADAICATLRANLEAIPGVRCDYVELVDAETLHEVTSPHRLALLAVAAWFGDVRLIDNIELSRS